MDFGDISKLVQEAAQESQTLEFKAGAALARGDKEKRELVKDVTGMANGSGGRIIYGLTEAMGADGINVASGYGPIVDGQITPDWVLQVVTGNTGPVLNGIEASEIALPDNSGRLIVLDVQAASTAHQSSLDQKYYQRIGRKVAPMLDFQVRDVMSRRTAPVLAIALQREWLARDGNRHVYGWVPVIRNAGHLSLERWTLEVELPEVTHDADLLAKQNRTTSHVSVVNVDGHAFRRFLYSSTVLTQHGISCIVEPGQELRLDQAIPFALPRSYVDRENYRELSRFALPIRWRLYLRDAKPQTQVMAFNEWCDF